MAKCAHSALVSKGDATSFFALLYVPSLLSLATSQGVRTVNYGAKNSSTVALTATSAIRSVAFLMVRRVREHTHTHIHTYIHTYARIELRSLTPLHPSYYPAALLSHAGLPVCRAVHRLGREQAVRIPIPHHDTDGHLGYETVGGTGHEPVLHRGLAVLRKRHGLSFRCEFKCDAVQVRAPQRHECVV